MKPQRHLPGAYWSSPQRKGKRVKAEEMASSQGFFPRAKVNLWASRDRLRRTGARGPRAGREKAWTEEEMARSRVARGGSRVSRFRRGWTGMEVSRSPGAVAGKESRPARSCGIRRRRGPGEGAGQEKASRPGGSGRRG